MYFDDRPRAKRTLGIRDKQILYRNAKGRCENPGCKKKIDFDEMQVGHMTAHSKGGPTTLKTTKCLCYRCNKLQSTDSWATFMRKQNIKDPVVEKKQQAKSSLESLTLAQLKSLAKAKNVKVVGSIKEDFFESHRVAPTKAQYVRKLSGVVAQADLKSLAKSTPVKAKSKR